MAKLTDSIKNKILAEWKTGVSQNQLSKNYSLSVATINKICKGIEQENIILVNTQAQINRALQEKSEQEVNAIQKAVEERTKHLLFFDNATLKNLSLMMQKIDKNSSIQEHKTAQDTIAKGKETIFGKEADTQVNVQTNTAVNNLIQVDYAD